MKIKMLIALMAVAFVLQGCAAAMHAPVSGFIYTGAKSGLTAGGDLGTKKGEACAQSILGIVGTGDASITAAAKQGGIKEITHVDEASTAILGVYAKHCTEVYGK